MPLSAAMRMARAASVEPAVACGSQWIRTSCDSFRRLMMLMSLR
jgi:hypothetical protein